MNLTNFQWCIDKFLSSLNKNTPPVTCNVNCSVIFQLNERHARELFLIWWFL